MCGIAGIWGPETSVWGADAAAAMLERLVHRGPDASGVHVCGADRGVLGHQRLSIMDPVGGDQPLLERRHERALVANGEIYNYPALRRDLEPTGRFGTGSDSEAILRLVGLQGPEAVAQLDGMFAFALADGDRLVLARDAIGIKPLYVGRANGALAFASELKAFTGLTEEVEEFPPGSLYDSRSGLRRWYALPPVRPVVRRVEDWCGEVRDQLERAVAKRMMSDVPLGAFLSGGLDSSLIAALARRHVGELHTFSVGIEGSRDLEAAQLVSRHLGSHHHEHVITREQVLRALPEIVYHLESYDQDLVRSAIPCYFTSRLAAEHVKVILTGEGADELFGGYAYYEGYDAEEAVLADELRRSVSCLHNINLQRVDRLTMAHSLEGRVPFLDTEFIEQAFSIPASLKRRAPAGGRPVEKWILRRAFEDELPAEIVWRAKEQFDEGSGTVDVLEEGLDHFLPRGQAGAYAAAHPGAGLRSFEECVYHKLLVDAYEKPELILGSVARWAERPAPARAGAGAGEAQAVAGGAA